MSTEVAPCRSESLVWRECLKTYDYGPERPEAECNRERVRYYACMKEWRAAHGQSSDASSHGEVVKGSMHPATAPVGRASPAVAFHASMPSDCIVYSNALHNCMMISLFEAAKCRDEMLNLRICASKFDKSIARALEEDVQMGRVSLTFEDDPDEATGIKRMWYKFIGKV